MIRLILYSSISPVILHFSDLFLLLYFLPIPYFSDRLFTPLLLLPFFYQLSSYCGYLSNAMDIHFFSPFFTNCPPTVDSQALLCYEYTLEQNRAKPHFWLHVHQHGPGGPWCSPTAPPEKRLSIIGLLAFCRECFCCKNTEECPPHLIPTLTQLDSNNGHRPLMTEASF